MCPALKRHRPAGGVASLGAVGAFSQTFTCYYYWKVARVVLTEQEEKRLCFCDSSRVLCQKMMLVDE